MNLKSMLYRAVDYGTGPFLDTPQAASYSKNKDLIVFEKWRCVMEEEFVSKDYAPWLSLLVGAVVGIGIGLMLAPKSGSELRKDIGDFAARGKDRIGAAVGSAVEQGRGIYEKGKGAAEAGKAAVQEKAA